MYLTLRDTSRDQRTYWLRDGLYYAKSRNLGDPSCELPADKVAQIPEGDRRIVVEEAQADPAFCTLLCRIMATDPNWIHRISDSAKAAAASEFDPKKAGTVKSWPKLRQRVRALLVEVVHAAHAEASKLSPEERLVFVKRVAQGGLRPQAAVHGLGNLGQFDIITSLVGSLANAGASIYGAKVTSDAQQDIAKIQATAAMQNAQAQLAIANANAAIASAQSFISPVTSAVSNVASALMTPTVAGIPMVVPLTLLVGVGVYLAFGRK